MLPKPANVLKEFVQNKVTEKISCQGNIDEIDLWDYEKPLWNNFYNIDNIESNDDGDASKNVKAEGSTERSCVIIFTVASNNSSSYGLTT